MDPVSFLNARYDSELNGPGSGREFLDPRGKPCPVEGCRFDIANWEFEQYHDHIVHKVEHHVYGPMPAPDWYAGDVGPSVSTHTVPNDLWYALTTGEYTQKALKVQRRVAAQRAILTMWADADQRRFHLPPGVAEGRDHDERMRDDAVADELDAVVRFMASEFADHPDYRAEWSTQ